MSSDSSSSDESDKQQRKRKHKTNRDKDKKLKKSKKQKKEKRRHKEKKRRRRDEEESLVESPRNFSLPNVNCDEDAFGPALPPHLVKSEPTQHVIGPIMPSDLIQKSSDTQCPTDQDDDDDGAGTFGPMPNVSQVELEERALALKLSVLEGNGLEGSTALDQDQREEWMLELPDVGLKGGLAALNNMKRTFYQGKERPDFTDRSSWTKTPKSEAAAAMGTKSVSSKELEKMAQAKYDRQRDEEQERMAKKHKKKHKRDESLVELHQKKLRKEQKERDKALAASGSKSERRPFSRDVDLKLNKIDKNQTKQIVDKAKILNTKFSSGHAKYL
ncbi:GPALPP motifs-containing protein 1-like isoform X2 [Drosophila tropicalis]|uniref:GPALPP motifs-containing protein 1-like isoform X2 n=1 Tax=Drosophila tropicalis TaxID=46794 RepID=UPI0035ABED72